MLIKDRMPKLVELDKVCLESRAAMVKPLIKVNNKLWTIQPVDLRNEVFTWDPKRLQQVDDVELVTSISTYHHCGHPALFKPSISEVLCQLPEDFAKQGICWFVTETEDVQICADGEGHKTTTHLYRYKADDVGSVANWG
jgi:hypothetical protein